MAIVEISLPNTKQVAIIDECDKDLADAKWRIAEISKYGFKRIMGQKARKTLYLGRIVLSRKLGRPLKASERASFINLNTYDCRRSNLRLASKAEVARARRKPITNTSGYKGVSWHKRDKCWQAYIRVDGKVKHLGCFDYPEHAYGAYCRAAEKYYGDFARLE